MKGKNCYFLCYHISDYSCYTNEKLTSSENTQMNISSNNIINRNERLQCNIYLSDPIENLDA